jgi:hypothetical protein
MFKAMNHAAWLTEVIAAALMLIPIPETRAAGGLLIIASFLFICTQIRLAWLTEMVIVCGLLFIPGSGPAVVDGGAGANALAAFLLGYLILLPLAHAGLFYNFYAQKRLPGALQWALERYTNFFGIIIWRVFSVDHLNFYVRIYEERDGQRRLISRYGSVSALRYSHVAESIAVTSVFTTLKYYASNPGLFEARLRRYARTIPVAAGVKLVFEYVSIQKRAGRFEDVPAVTYTVSPGDWSIVVTPLVDEFSVHAAHEQSPVHEARAPGTYAPAAR